MTSKKNKKPKCYLYIRVSTEMQVEGYSIEAQRERLTRFADYQGMEIVHEYCDAGKSGKSIVGRPEFSRMLQDVSNEKDGVEFILVFKLSRFGRNAADVLNSLQHIQDYGVNLICVEDGIDSSKESGKLTITVLSAVAEIERENILVQTMEGRKQKAREGKWNGGRAPFGYKVDKENETLIVDPDEAEIVKIVYEKFAFTTMGIDAIAEYLNNHGYVKNRSRDYELNYFTKGIIKHILDNPVYLGKIVYGRTITEKVKGTRDQYHRISNDDCLIFEGKHESIIDEELWLTVRAKRQETGIAWQKTYSLDHEHLLSGLVKCPVCGTGMCGMVHRYRKRKTNEYRDKFYYRCKQRKRLPNGEKCNFGQTISQETLNAQVESVVLDMVRDDKFREFVMSKMEEKVDTSNLQIERDNLREQLRQAEASKRKLMEQIEKLDANDRHYNRKYQDMQDRLDIFYDKIDELEEAIIEVNKKINCANDEQFTTESLCKALLNFDIMYDKMSDADKKQFFQSFIKTIEIDADSASEDRLLKHILFKFPVSIDVDEGEKLLPKENDVEVVSLLQRVSNTRERTITLDVEMEDYHRIKGDT